MKNRLSLLDARFVAGSAVALAGVAVGVSVSQAPTATAAVAAASVAQDGSKFDAAGATECAVTWDVFESVAVEVHAWLDEGSCYSIPTELTMDADLDGNGTTDLVLPSWRNQEALNGSGGTVYASRLSGGTRELLVIHQLAAPASQYAWLQGVVSYRVFPVACRDMSGDGMPDLVCVTFHNVGKTSFYSLCYFRNKLVPQSASAADINRDGIVNGADLTMLLVAWGQGS